MSGNVDIGNGVNGIHIEPGIVQITAGGNVIFLAQSDPTTDGGAPPTSYATEEYVDAKKLNTLAN